MKVTMSDILVSSYKTEPQAPGSNTGNAESISFNFTKIEFASRRRTRTVASARR